MERNNIAYMEAEALLDHQIETQSPPPFAVVVLDVNDLKKVNDTSGHQAGDQYLREACRMICQTFKHSPVFRVGGDEFAVIAQGYDYEHINELIRGIEKHNQENIRGGGVVIACGMAGFAEDTSVASVFQRADMDMYANKQRLKETGKAQKDDAYIS